MKIGNQYNGISCIFLKNRNFGCIKCEKLDVNVFFHLDKFETIIYPKLETKAKYMQKYDKTNKKNYADKVKIYDN